MCTEDCHRRNINCPTETIIENVRRCAGCSTRNVELMVCLSGGPVPAQQKSNEILIPSLVTNNDRVMMQASRHRPKQINNQGFFEFLRRRRESSGSNVMAIDAAREWSYKGEEEKATYVEPSTFNIQF